MRRMQITTKIKYLNSKCQISSRKLMPPMTSSNHRSPKSVKEKAKRVVAVQKSNKLYQRRKMNIKVAVKIWRISRWMILKNKKTDGSDTGTNKIFKQHYSQFLRFLLISPKNIIQYVSAKNEPVTDAADAERYLAQKPDIYRCICSLRDRLSFYAGIQIILGTV